MNAIMLDNWATQDVVFDAYNIKEDISESYGKLLSAIILWDKVYYPHNEKTVMWGLMKNSKIFSILNPLDDSSHLFEKEACNIFDEYYKNIETSIIAKEGIRYLLLSNFMGIDYLPSSKRGSFFEKCTSDNFWPKLSRYDFIGILDKEINDYFEEYNDKFGRKVFDIRRPVLTDFIIQNTPCNMSYLEFAMQLRNEKCIVQYRKYLTDLEIALENRDWTKLAELFILSHEAVSKVCHLDKKSIGNIDVAVIPFPSINFSKEIEVGKRKVHLTFLDKLANFAFCGRKIY